MESLKVCFVGAGTVNFGGAEHPWNHSRRLEQIGSVTVVAIVDPLVEKAETILRDKKANASTAAFYTDCQVFSNLADAIKAKSIDVAYVGLPPNCHGSFERDIELQLLGEGIHVFVEKPVSVVPTKEFNEYVRKVENITRDKNLMVGVGYMFRYHPGFVKMKEVLAEYGRPIMAINARYSCTYSQIDRPFWWDLDRSGGPIVEQATHFCDIIRFLGGEVREGSVMGMSVLQSSDVGHLTAIPEAVRKADIPRERQIPVVTQSVFAYEGGGLCSLVHTATLQGKMYESNIDVWCDGLRMTIVEPYSDLCELSIRYPNDDKPKVHTYPDADPYYAEDEAFLKAVRTGDSSLIRSGYGDAARTYCLTRAIRNATMNTSA